MKMRILVFSFGLILLFQPSLAQDRAAIERQFQSWLQETVWPRAKAKGVTRETMQQALSDVTLDWKLPDLVPPGSTRITPKVQKQAEFGSPGRYFNPGSVQGATSAGRKWHGAMPQLWRRSKPKPAFLPALFWRSGEERADTDRFRSGMMLSGYCRPRPS